MTKIMLLGAAGQVGQAVMAATLPPRWQISTFSRDDLDLTDRHAVRHAFHKLCPDLVINAAAMVDVDQAEQNESDAMRINFEAPANLAALCSQSDVPLIHLSTDYVFDGTEQQPSLPDDPVNPLNIYGKTKFLGEEAVRQELAWHVVLRISSVFSEFRNNLLTKTINWLDTREEIQIVTDQILCPTYARDIAKAIVTIGSAIMDGKIDGFGMFHYCGFPSTTRYEFVREILSLYAPRVSKVAKLSPTVSSTFASLARRPAYSVLNCDKIKKIYGLDQSDWKTGLSEAIETIVQQRKA